MLNLMLIHRPPALEVKTISPVALDHGPVAETGAALMIHTFE